ncbi:MAG: GNAT family N-acetyltransferase, partial [Planctomycetota bacterium]|nr:GNAT family N-acetyltransferase [Planctomycetota bacterium]
MLNDKLQAAIAKFEKQAKWPEDNDKFSFRVAVKDDYPQINMLFETTFGEQRTPEHVRWKYWGCPSGEPFAIIAEDASTKKLVAACTGMIKKAWVNGKESSGIMLWDIAVHPDVRGGGRLYRDITYGMQVAVNAQRQVNWGFGGQSKPNVIKMGIRWFGYHMILSLKPYELRLTLAPALKQRFGPLLGSAVAKIADCFVASPQPSNKFSFKNISECGPEFDQLFEQQPKLYKVSIWRDAATLNWRYFDNPIYKHSMLAAYANDKLQGYVVWREYTDGSATVATVLDLWHGEDQQLAQDLFLAAAQQAKSRG